MSSSQTQAHHPQIQVGDLVAICSHTILYTSMKGEVGVVVAIAPQFYNEPQTYHRETFEPVMTDRVEVLWSSGQKTFEPANCLKRIAKIKKNT